MRGGLFTNWKTNFLYLSFSTLYYNSYGEVIEDLW